MTLDVFFQYFEWFAAAIALIYVIFQIIQKPLMWYLAILAAVMYLAVYVFNGLYAMAAIQAYLIGAGIYGLIEWTRTKKRALGTENEGKIIVKPFEWKVGVVSVLIALAVFFVLHYVLKLAAAPGDPAWKAWMDAFLSTNTMLITFYTGRRYIVSWPLWFINDAIAAVVYFKLGMLPTGILFSIYLITATIGYINWQKNGVWEERKN